MAFSDLAERVHEVRDRIEAASARGGHGQTVRMIAVTKTHGPDAVDAAAACGLTDVGENKVQEALEKMQAATASVRWHLIGHLQRNKAKAAPHFGMVHSLDSVRLADALNAAATDADTLLDVLVQARMPFGIRYSGGQEVAAGCGQLAAGELGRAPGARMTTQEL